MKTTFYFIISILAGIAISSCSQDNSKVASLQKEIDSIKEANRDYKNDIAQMSSFVKTISTSIDSIMFYEDSLLFGKDREGIPKITKEQVKLNLEILKSLVERQKQQIFQLRQELNNAKGDNAEMMKKLVDYYEAQLNEKDRQIANLQAELEQKNVDISQLRTKVNSLNNSKKQLEKQTELQSMALQVQNEILNTGYIQIGTKKELAAKGLLTGGFLKKKKVDTAKLSQENFNKVDISQFNDVKLQSKKPKILTQMPTSSYEIINNGDGTSTLHINNPNMFWSVSNFLIIQL